MAILRSEFQPGLPAGLLFKERGLSLAGSGIEQLQRFKVLESKSATPAGPRKKSKVGKPPTDSPFVNGHAPKSELRAFSQVGPSQINRE